MQNPPPSPEASTSPRKRRFKVDEPSGLPAFSYRQSGDIRSIYCRAISQANAFASVGELKGPLGFDIEWRPAFQRGQKNKVAVVQLASAQLILVIQVSMMSSFPLKVKEVLENPFIPKVGVGIYDDALKLWEDYGIRLTNAVELSHLARAVDTTLEGPPKELISLAKLVEKYKQLELVKKKSIVMSNWEMYLSSAQQQYAANDAYAGYQVYRHLVSTFPSAGAVHPTEYTTDFDPDIEAVRQVERQVRKEERHMRQLEEKAKKEAKALAGQPNDEEALSSDADAVESGAEERHTHGVEPQGVHQSVKGKASARMVEVGRDAKKPRLQLQAHNRQYSTTHLAEGSAPRTWQEERAHRALIPCPYPAGTCKFGPARCHYLHAAESSIASADWTTSSFDSSYI